MNQHNYFRLFANCILTRGATRASVVDIQRSIVTLIPNDLYDILTENKNKSLEQIKKIYGKENEQVINDYFAFLLTNELIFFCQKKDLKLFPDLDLTYINPARITNAILDFDINSHYDYKKVFLQLEELGCKNIQIRFFCITTIEHIVNLLSHLNKSLINSVELYLKYNAVIDDVEYVNITKENLRVTNLIIHSAPKNELLPNDFASIYFTTEIIKDNTHCGIISPAYFSINIKTFTEAQQHNSCLNRKISIDVNGDIKNCPSLPQSFGNIAETSLQSALLHKNFKDLWLINKDQIEVCKDCEFRYICTDCRAFITKPEDKFSKPSKCSYNPYMAEWE
jgi:SPASM domain peptide maturase of grasp-with-spasm system